MQQIIEAKDIDILTMRLKHEIIQDFDFVELADQKQTQRMTKMEIIGDVALKA